MQNILVLRDTSTGSCYLLHASAEEIDVDRLEEGGREIAGYLEWPEQYNRTWSDTLETKHGDLEAQGVPMFTTCEYPVRPDIPADDNAVPNRFCNRLILIIDDGAPEYCTEHETDE